MKEIFFEGSINTATIPQLNLNNLVTGWYVREAAKGGGSYQQNVNSPVINILSDCTTSDRKITVSYETINQSGRMNYEIQIEAINSNLGKDRGVNLYLLCPLTHKRAKILYYCLKSHLFIHRTAFSKRLRYPFESYGKIDKAFAYSQQNQNKLYKCFLEMKKETYRGEQTKLNKKIGRLIDRKILLDRLINDWTAKH